MKLMHYGIGLTLAAVLLSGCGSSTGTNTPTYKAYASSNNLKQVGLEVELNSIGNQERKEIKPGEQVKFGKNFKEGDGVTLIVTQQPVGQYCEMEVDSFLFDDSDLTINVDCRDLDYFVFAHFNGDIPDGESIRYSGTYNGEKDIFEDGDIVLQDIFHYGDVVNFDLNSVYGHQCTGANASITITQDTSLDFTCQSVGSISGIARDYYTGDPVANAELTVYRFDNDQWIKTSTSISDENGLYELTAIGISEQFLLRIETPDFVNNSILLGNSESQPDVVQTTLLFRSAQRNRFSIDQNINITDDNTSLVEIPANSLETISGGGIIEPVQVRVTKIDPSSNPQLMPGDYRALVENGETELIESFGAINVSLTDAAGNRLDLKQGETATIKIPVADNIINPPEQIPLYYFDESSALWKEDGLANLVEINGESYYQGNVSHFTTWNADRAYTSVNISGCVVDIEGNIVSNARISAQGQNYNGTSHTYSNSNGQFVLPVRPSSSILISALKASQGNTISANSSTTDKTLSECLRIGQNSATVTLTWGASPNDLDTHFWGPDDSSDNYFHVYFVNQDEQIGNTQINLDVDDTSSFGPEVLTIDDFALPGRYRYAVDHYSGLGTIFSSPTRVELNLAGQIRVFSPTVNANSYQNSNRYWVVFDLVVDADKQVTIVPINQYASSSNVQTIGVEGLSARPMASRVATFLPKK